MSIAVNLLLFFSALLSALTGVVGSVRQPQVAQAVAQQIESIAKSAGTRLLGTRPAAARFTPATSRDAPIARVFALVAIEPIFSGRRRE